MAFGVQPSAGTGPQTPYSFATSNPALKPPPVAASFPTKLFNPATDY